jgi:hypothetical protein
LAIYDEENEVYQTICKIGTGISRVLHSFSLFLSLSLSLSVVLDYILALSLGGDALRFLR